VDIRSEPPSIPPEEEVRARKYEYSPCPLIPQPPVPSKAFLHYLNFHATEGTLRGRKWFNRFPKKLERSLLDVRRTTEIEKDVIGWGVHIIEGPNLIWITLFTLIVVIISGIVSVVYSIAMNDVSGGFGIGAWIIAFWVALVTALYFQWKQT